MAPIDDLVKNRQAAKDFGALDLYIVAVDVDVFSKQIVIPAADRPTKILAQAIDGIRRLGIDPQILAVKCHQENTVLVGRVRWIDSRQHVIFREFRRTLNEVCSNEVAADRQQHDQDDDEGQYKQHDFRCRIRR